MSLLQRIWTRLRAPLAFLWPLRLVILPIALLLWAFVASDQGQDAIRAVVEFDPRWTRWRGVALFVGMIVVLSMQAWYWARQLLRIHDRSHDGFEVWIPRLLGLSAYLIAIAALLKARQSYGTEGRYTDTVIAVTCVALAILAILFIAFVMARRQMISGSAMAAPRAVASHRDLAPSTRGILLATIAIAVVFIVWSIVSPLSAGAIFHTPAVLVLAATLWIGIGSFVAYWADYSHVPLVAFLVVATILFSGFNDNHAVRKLDATVGPRLNVESTFDGWYRKLAAKYGTQRQPVFIVATEGGGIRAAYWTAAVLTALQDRAPAFGDHLFALSGVSGGALGSTVFTALLADRDRDHAVDERGTAVDPAAQRTYRYAAQQVLSYDFLAPTLVSMLFSDFVQRFLPVGVLPDRAKALETAWERGWSTSVRRADGSHDPFFSSGLMQMYAANQNRPFPSLFLNGTSVERGKRLIASNCDVSSGTEILDSGDVLTQLGSDIRLSTASTNSARFTYVSPAGTVHDASGSVRGHVVDGGYFENSGAETAADIVTTILSKSAAHGWNVEPIVIFIQFGQLPPASPAPERFMNEALSPVRALLGTRDARGTLSVAQAERLSETRWFRFLLVQADKGIRLPLGWLLARRSRNAIDMQVGSVVPPTLRPELRPYVEQNVAAVNEIAAIVAPPMRLRAAKRAAPVMDAVQQEAIASEQHLAQPQ